ncbi:CT620/CT621 family type III secretion system effector [Chlamydia felis]|nr:CT620/CT621 family type III secretion system effector [Chlamydia felis]
MDIINSYSVSENYKKLPITLCSVSVQKRNELLENLFQYKKTEAERLILQQLIRILDQQSDKKYRLLVEKLRKSEIEDRVISKKSHTVAVHHKPLSDTHSPIAVVATTSAVGDSAGPNTADPFYNSVKQQWANRLLQGIQEVVNTIVQAAGSQNSDVTALQAIQSEVNRLVAAGMNLTDKDFTSLYALPQEICSTVQRATIFTGGKKADYINMLSNKYEDASLLSQVFGDSRVRGLQLVLAVVKSKLTEEEYSIFLELEGELNKLGNSVQSYSADLFNLIDQLGDQLSDTINTSALSRNDKIDLCARISSLYKDQVAAIESFNVIHEAAVFVNRHQEAVFNQISSLVSSFIGVFAPIDLGNVTVEISSAALSGAVQAIRAINSRFNDLTVKQQQLVNQALTTVPSFAGGNYVGAVWAYFIASTVLANKPLSTMAEVGNVIKEEAKELTGSLLSIASTIQNTMTGIVTQNGQFVFTLNGNEQYTIYSNNSGKTTINPVLLNRGTVGLLKNVTSRANQQAESTARTYFQFKGLAEVETIQLGALIDTSREQLQDCQDLKAELYKEELLSRANELQAMALPSAVASVLIDRYMPKEVDFLNSIYSQLYYSNLGSSVGNAMIDAISEYINAATYFNFASYVGQQPAVGQKGKDEFPGTADSARAKLETERQKAASYLKSTQQAEVVLAEQIKKVTEDSKITEEQRSRIIDSLNNYKDNLNAVSGSLVLLQNYLAPLSIENGSVPGTFIVRGGEDQWQARLEILEDALVSGLSGNAINGGMFPLQAMIQADQQSYADMGQNYQLELQMHLTSMQQEWTVVATSLQVLNQMYLSLARSLMG